MDPAERRLQVLQSGKTDDPTCLTFVLKGEDHTLGNSLRFVINQNPQVKFCGYSVPHPSEKKINFRIQTYGAPAADVFKKGLEDLQKICDHVAKTFKTAHEDYETKKAEDVDTRLEAMHTDE